MGWKDYVDIGRSLSLIFQLGLIVVVSVGLCLYIGLKLDGWFQTRGLFTVLGILLGIASGFWESYLLITRSKCVYGEVR